MDHPQKRERLYSLVLCVWPSPDEFACGDWAERPRACLFFDEKRRMTGILVLSGNSQAGAVKPPISPFWVLCRFWKTRHGILKSEHEANARFSSVLFWYSWRQTFTSARHCCLWPRSREGPQKCVDAARANRLPFHKVVVYQRGEKHGRLHSAWQNAVCSTPVYVSFLSYA